MTELDKSLTLAREIRRCTACPDLPLGPQPIFQLSPSSRILIAGQAPGKITHEKGVPFDDPSGHRLREWLGVARDDFYDSDLFAVVPMAFCFPGSGKSGDFPPPPECARRWRGRVLESLTNIQLTIVIGRYAAAWHLGLGKEPIAEIVARWRDTLPSIIVLPHPSPRNNRWLRQHPWFEDELLPDLKDRVARIKSG
ncbi:MAG: uracil-DNA glycosylase family protein [Erythrobacter sp.]